MFVTFRPHERAPTRQNHDVLDRATRGNRYVSAPMHRGDIQQRLIRRYELLLREEVAKAHRQPVSARPAALGARSLAADVVSAVAGAQKTHARATERRLT